MDQLDQAPTLPGNSQGMGWGQRQGTLCNPWPHRTSARQHREASYTEALLRPQASMVHPLICKPAFLKKSQSFSTPVCTCSFPWLARSWLAAWCLSFYVPSFLFFWQCQGLSPELCIWQKWRIASLVNLESQGRSLSERLSALGWLVGISMQTVLSWCLKPHSLWVAPFLRQGLLNCIKRGAIKLLTNKEAVRWTCVCSCISFDSCLWMSCV